MKPPVILKIFRSNQLIEVKQFVRDQIILGQDAEAQLVLKDAVVSPLHCLIENRANGYFILDLGSTTGTSKNGKQILDDPISSGDTIEVGPFKIQFFVGVPKLNTESVTTASTSPPAQSKVSIPENNLTSPPISSAVKETIIRPATTKIRSTTGTYAPESKEKDLNKIVKTSKGTAIQVLVTWKERVLSATTFKGNKKISIGSSGTVDVITPKGTVLMPSIFGNLSSGICQITAPSGGELFIVKQEQERKVDKSHTLQQEEVAKIVFLNGEVQVLVRYCEPTKLATPIPFLDLSMSEMAALFLSLVVVFLSYVVVSINLPKEVAEEKPIEPERIAEFVYNKVTPPPTPPDVRPPEPPKPPPPQRPKKVKVDETKPKQNAGAAAGQAAEVAPKDGKNKNKFTSIKQGGAVKITDAPAANAQSKDVNKQGLLGAFGGSGIRQKIDQAYSGTGSLLGASNQATGKTGQNENRGGDDIGSRFKDTGSGGKGTATEGIAGVGTKGKGSGQAGYGAGTGLGGKGNVNISIGGAGENWEGSIDREAVRRVIRSIQSQIRSCYERELRSNSSLEGKVVIQFEIMEQGRVRVAGTKSSTLNNSNVESCVAARIKDQRFPEPPTGQIAVVDFPFVFNKQQ